MPARSYFSYHCLHFHLYLPLFSGRTRSSSGNAAQTASQTTARSRNVIANVIAKRPATKAAPSMVTRSSAPTGLSAADTKALQALQKRKSAAVRKAEDARQQGKSPF